MFWGKELREEYKDSWGVAICGWRSDWIKNHRETAPEVKCTAQLLIKSLTAETLFLPIGNPCDFFSSSFDEIWLTYSMAEV